MTRKQLFRITACIALALPLVLAGCEGDDGPAGPPGPAGQDGQDAYTSDFTYVGDHGMDCNHCHGKAVDQVMHSGHAHAYDSLADKNDQENPYCLQCHTTGWDRSVAYDGTMGTDNPDVNGYDDYFGVEGDEAMARRVALEGVQCESCHGAMGPDFNAHQPDVSFATVVGPDLPDDIVSPCFKCHTTQFAGPEGDYTGGYATSGHASVADGDLAAFNDEHYAHIASCNGCHTSEGFIRENDPSFADYEFGEMVNFIGCVTCHDPHMGADGGGNEAQVRNVGPVPVSYTFPYEPGDAEVPTMSGKGTGQLCAQCHHGRRDTDNVQGQIANGYAHFGPHHSAQMDLYIGGGCYELPGFSYDSTHPHQNAEKACVSCHMVRETELHGSTQDYAFHNFRPDVGTNCNGCHNNIDETYITTFQATIETKMNSLATRFGYSDYHDMEENWDSTGEAVTTWEREAAYAMYFLLGDGSLGVHNPDYAEDLMDAALAHYDANATP